MNVLVLHGPNLNLLGEREPEIYGRGTLAQLNARLRAHARKRKTTLRVFQSNHEGRLVDLIHANRRWADGLVINPGAYSHYSYAIRDAIAAAQLPAVEAHLSNIRKREAFRRLSVVAPACVAQICGKGVDSYIEALDLLIERAAKRA